MHRLLFRRMAAALLFVVVALTLAAPAQALEVPPLQGAVNDHAGVLAPEVKSRLGSELDALRAETGIQIVVLTIPTLAGEALEEFSMKTASAWGLGEKREDNGALLLMAMQERKLRIEVGYGLEDKLTDLMSSRIIREAITPAFKRGDYAAGIAQGVAALQEVARTGSFTPPQPAAAPAAASHPASGAAPAPLGAASMQAGAGASEGASDGQATLIALLCSAAGAFMRLRRLRWWHAWLAGVLVGAALGAYLAFSPGGKVDNIWGGALVGWMLAWACFGVLCWLCRLWEIIKNPELRRRISSDSSWRDSGPSYSSRSYGSSSRSYSGGGGRFGGGGASGSW